MIKKNLIYLPLLAILTVMSVGCQKDCNCPEPEPVPEVKDTLEASLVAYYTFTGNVLDSTKNHNDGQLFGATLTTDKFSRANKAFLFNGTSDHIKIPNSTSTDIKESFTVSAWVLPQSSNNDALGIFWRGDSQKEHDPIVLLYNGKFIIRKDVGTGNTINQVESTGLFSYVNRWTNVIGVFDAPSKTMRLYINGELEKTNTFVDGTINYATQTFYNTIGSVETIYGHFKGKIDEVRLYNRPLTPEEVKKVSLTYY